VRYVIPSEGPVEIDVLDLEGRLVATLEHGPRSAGSHEAAWDGRDAHGGYVASGVYWVLLRTNAASVTAKAIRLR